MRSLVSILLAVAITASLTAVACGEYIFLDRRGLSGGNYGPVELYDASVAPPLELMEYDDRVNLPEGLALSPDERTLYLVGRGSSSIRCFNTSTGVELASYTVGKTSKGLTVDSAGNIYAASSEGTIYKVAITSGTVAAWGEAPSADFINDLEVYGGKLYGGGERSSTHKNMGVWTWDLSGANEGKKALLAGTDIYTADGVAINPVDGTIYTSSRTENSIFRWDWNDSESKYEAVTIMDFGVDPISGEANKSANDVDYFDGHLYLARYHSKSGVDTHQIGKIDLSDPDNYTYTTIIDFSSEGANMPRHIVVTDVNPIPEPSALALLATGLIGLLAYAWRKRK